MSTAAVKCPKCEAWVSPDHSHWCVNDTAKVPETKVTIETPVLGNTTPNLGWFHPGAPGYPEVEQGSRPETAQVSTLPRTLGELSDRLSIINVKLYVMQDRVHEAAQKGEGLDAETVKKLASLNMDRSKTMNAIDACLADAVKSGKTTVEERVKIE